jgi:hypothetical protein
VIHAGESKWVRFDHGQRLLSCGAADGPATAPCDVFSFSPALADRSGAWLAGDKNYDDLVEWYLVIAIEHEGVLYLHHRNESLFETAGGLD